jgi:hypothetical protein
MGLLPPDKSTAECPVVYHIFSVRFHKNEPIEISSGCQDLVKDTNPAKHCQNSTTMHAFRLRFVDMTLVVLALLLLTLVATAGANPGNDNRAPDLGSCQNLHVLARNKVAFHVYAEGVQMYRWDGTSWIFFAPEAVLFADAGDEGAVGIHYAGPTWQSVSGSKVAGTVLERCTPDPDTIAWLLLGTVFNEGPGIFHRVTFIQRVNTVGGNAPTFPGNFQGQVTRVPYTAEYFFYRAHD